MGQAPVGERFATRSAGSTRAYRAVITTCQLKPTPGRMSR